MYPQTAPAIVIPLRKGKVALLLFGSIAFVGMGVGMWLIADSQTRFHAQFVKGAALATVSFFGLCGIFCCIKIFDKKPGLVIDKEGVVDNSSAVSVGRIRWEEVTGLRVSRTARRRFITIDVVHPEIYTSRGGLMQRLLNAANARMFGSPINITPNVLAANADEVLRLLTKAWERYKANRHG